MKAQPDVSDIREIGSEAPNEACMDLVYVVR
ncbi:hypothetical protein S2M10_29830 [Sphingomonas sp. S2M10]|nr:hypothetical protein [Sphingomonas sp. S2M10]